MSLVVLTIGSPVTIGNAGVQVSGVVTSIMISAGNSVSYRVAWWDDNDRQSEWLEDFEVKPTDASFRQVIGFRTIGA